MRLAEINANVTDGCDVVELHVVEGGETAGFVLKERVSSVVTLPDAVVAADDVVVVRLNSGNAACNPEGAANDPAPQGGVWNLWSTDSGLTATDNVLRIVDALGATQDTVFVTDAATGTAAKDTETAAAQAVEEDQWTNPDGSIPAGGFVDDAFNASAVVGLKDTGTTADGPSIQRTGGDTNTKTDWTVGPSSIGAL